MRKFLLPIFGGILLTTSVSLTTGQNINQVIKVAEEKRIKEQAFLNVAYEINSQSGLNTEQINTLELAAQCWDNDLIDSVLNKFLQYRDNQLVIDKHKLDATNLPLEILENIDLALDNLNNAVNLGFIKVSVTSNNLVQLVYPKSTANNDIIYFDESLSSHAYNSAYGAYMWYSTYGPSRWWKFWEWGGYIHFSEAAVQNAKYVNIILDMIIKVEIIASIIINIGQFANIISKLGIAAKVGNAGEINILMKELSKILGGVSLDLLGNVFEIIAVFSVFVTFFSEINLIPILAGVLVLVINIISSIIKQIVNGDRGNGVKWQWHNFIIPGSIFPE